MVDRGMSWVAPDSHLGGTNVECPHVATYTKNQLITNWQTEHLGLHCVFEADKEIAYKKFGSSECYLNTLNCSRGIFAVFVYTAVDSNEEIVYFYDEHENVINSVGMDGTNMRQFVKNGSFIIVLFKCTLISCGTVWSCGILTLLTILKLS